MSLKHMRTQNTRTHLHNVQMDKRRCYRRSGLTSSPPPPPPPPLWCALVTELWYVSLAPPPGIPSASRAHRHQCCPAVRGATWLIGGGSDYVSGGCRQVVRCR